MLGGSLVECLWGISAIRGISAAGAFLFRWQFVLPLGAVQFGFDHLMPRRVYSSTGGFWRWGVIAALGGCDSSRERCPCLEWPVDPLWELHAGVHALPRR
jgi:hypothetical protein